MDRPGFAGRQKTSIPIRLRQSLKVSFKQKAEGQDDGPGTGADLLVREVQAVVCGDPSSLTAGDRLSVTNVDVKSSPTHKIDVESVRIYDRLPARRHGVESKKPPFFVQPKVTT